MTSHALRGPRNAIILITAESAPLCYGLSSAGDAVRWIR